MMVDELKIEAWDANAYGVNDRVSTSSLTTLNSSSLLNRQSAIADRQSRAELFDELAREAAACVVCPALAERVAVLSRANGTLAPRVLFIAEAPGRMGGDRTRIPFTGDQSGKNFDRFLQSVKLTRAEIFITNSALCNPRKDSGANRSPTVREVKNCSAFLQRQIALLDPPVVVTLGRVALEAVRLINYHPYTLTDSAGKVRAWQTRLLVPLYHPSPQVIASHRRFDEQVRDWRAVKRAVRSYEMSLQKLN